MQHPFSKFFPTHLDCTVRQRLENGVPLRITYASGAASIHVFDRRHEDGHTIHMTSRPSGRTDVYEVDDADDSGWSRLNAAAYVTRFVASEIAAYVD